MTGIYCITNINRYRVPIIQCDLMGKKIAEFESVKNASIALGIRVDNIYNSISRKHVVSKMYRFIKGNKNDRI
jgi:hypothetical protein